MHSTPYYWQNKSKVLSVFTTVPFGMTNYESLAWLRYGGGQALWDETYGKFGLKGFHAGSTSVQMAGWFNKEIKSAADFQGLKMRIPGLGGEALRKLGATIVNLPVGEIFGALQSGAIDATEWVGPWQDLAAGFYKVDEVLLLARHARAGDAQRDHRQQGQVRGAAQGRPADLRLGLRRRA